MYLCRLKYYALKCIPYLLICTQNYCILMQINFLCAQKYCEFTCAEVLRVYVRRNNMNLFQAYISMTFNINTEIHKLIHKQSKRTSSSLPPFQRH